MKVQDELFELVRSLTKNEKRYIQLFAAQTGDNKSYMDLFSALDKIKDNDGFDEKKFKEKYKKEKFNKNYAFNKHYLYNLIIKCLVSYNADRSIDAKLHRMIMQCKILFDKTLYKQYFRSIKKAKDFALKHERFGYYLQVLEMEKIIIKKEEIQGLKSETIYNEANSAIKNLSDIFELGYLASQALDFYREHGIIRDESQLEPVKKLLSHRVLQNPERLSAKAKETYYRIYEVLNDAKADYDAKYEAQIKRLETVNTSSLAFKDQILNYDADVLLSIIDSALNLDKTDEAEKYLEKYKNTGVSKGSDRDDLEIMAAVIEFRIHMKKKDVKKIKRNVSDFENILVKYKNKMLIDTELEIRYDIVKYHMLTGDFKNALTKANLLLAHPFLNKRADFESYIRILNLIIHFELKNYDLLKYLIISTYRFLYKRKKLFGLELLILEFIRKLPEIKDEDDLKFTFQKFSKRMEALKNDSFEKNAFEYFDFSAWIKDKIT